MKFTPNKMWQRNLSVTWKDRRKELGRLQRARKFTQAGDVRRAFKVEIEDLKKKTRRNRCHQVGHWARECKNAAAPSAGKSGGKGKGKNRETGAAFVEDFIATVESSLSPLEWLRQHRRRSDESYEMKTEQTTNLEGSTELLLVSSPGYGVLDSGCGRSIVGEQTFAEFCKLWQAQGIEPPTPFQEVNHFRYGNGQQETAMTSVKLPVFLGSCTGSIKAAVVRGQAPLLISRGALQTLKASINFATNELTLFDGLEVIPLQTNSAGQYIVNLMSSSPDSEKSENDFEIMAATEAPKEVTFGCDCDDGSQDEGRLPSSPSSSPSSLQTWLRHDMHINQAITTGKQGPPWHQVVRRRVINSDNNQVLYDDWIDHKRSKHRYHQKIPQDVMHVTTEFQFHPQEVTMPSECLPVHCLRQIDSQLRRLNQSVNNSSVGPSKDKPLVAEVFSPPRFTTAVESIGGVGSSFDIKNGYDLSKPSVRDQVERQLSQNPPELLILCPPCTDEGGWFNLNACTMDTQEYLRRIKRSRMFIRFCCRLFDNQVKAGGRALFEHPKGSKLWTYPEVQALMQKHYVASCHMCRYGLRVPGSDKLIRKATNLLVSHAYMQQALSLQCPGACHPKHKCHQTIAGSAAGVGSISEFAGQYTPAFVQAVLRTVPVHRQLESNQAVECHDWVPKHGHEVLAAKAVLRSEATDDELMKVIDKISFTEILVIHPVMT